jgi:hypothetical protein
VKRLTKYSIREEKIIRNILSIREERSIRNRLSEEDSKYKRCFIRE